MMTAVKSAVLGIWRYRDLVRNLVAKDVKVRYMGATLGFAWSLVNPLFMTLVYLFVFTFIFSPPLPNFPLYLVSGMIHWLFFSQTLSQSADVLVANANLLKRVRFPRALITVAGVLTNLLLWLAALVILLLVMPFLGGHYSLALLTYPFYLALLILFNWGLCLLVSSLYVEFRDLKHLIEVFLQVLFWATPIVYSLQMLSPRLQMWLLWSPLTQFITIFHHIFFDAVVPSWRLTLGFAGWSLLTVTLGIYTFHSRVDGAIEEL
jgi:lipopolysaccharide transport system permease protein